MFIIIIIWHKKLFMNMSVVLANLLASTGGTKPNTRN